MSTRMDVEGAGAIEARGGSMSYVFAVTLVAALGGLLFGYDTAVISGANPFLAEHFHLGSAAKGWAASSALIGCIVGVCAAGILSDWLGRKRVLLFCAVLFLASAIGTAVPRTLFVFIVFRILGGVGVGAASMTSPLYIAEISPASVRGRMVSINQFAIVFGMLVVYFVNYFIARSGTEEWNVTTGWRWMFGSESVPAALLLALVFLVPESPRWLVKRGRGDEAMSILRRVNGEQRAALELADIRETIEHESGSVRVLLRGGLRKVLLIGVVLAILQQVTGINVFLYYAPDIFRKLGAGTDSALMQTIVVGAVNMLFTVVAIWSVDRLGRKPLMMVGFGGMGLSLFAMGIAAFLQKTEMWVLACILGYIACFALAVGPVTWVILSEIFPTRIRGRAMAVATFFLWSANFVVSQTFPMLNENPRLVAVFHHALPFWVYGALCVVGIVFVWLVIPETRERSLEDIERMWGIAPGDAG